MQNGKPLFKVATKDCKDAKKSSGQTKDKDSLDSVGIENP